MQEIESLRTAFGGSVSTLYPGKVYRPWIPRRRLRKRQVQEWLELDRKVDLHHVVTDRPLGYSILKQLSRPVVSRLLTPSYDIATLSYLASFGPIVVSAPAEVGRLKSDYDLQAESIPPGIDTDLLGRVPKPPEGPFTLLFASAPWTRRQFASKGLDALCLALSERPELRLILLGRGVLTTQIERRLGASGLAERTEFIKTTVVPHEVLARVHATVLAPSSPRVVKAYPHSLLEALAAGRPVLTSPCLAVADLVRDHGCGLVTDSAAGALGRGLDRLVADYPVYQDATERLDMSRFSIDRCIADYSELYQRTLEQHARS